MRIPDNKIGGTNPCQSMEKRIQKSAGVRSGGETGGFNGDQAKP